MRDNINMAEIEQYNNTLRQYKDKSANLKAEISYNQKAIADLCAELTQEIGQEVTPENIEEVYNEQVAKIESALHSGQIILSKITDSENNSQAQQNNVGQAPQQIPQTPVNNLGNQQNVQNVQNAQAQQAQQGMFMNPPQQTGAMPEYLQQSFYGGAPAGFDAIAQQQADLAGLANQKPFKI